MKKSHIMLAVILVALVIMVAGAAYWGYSEYAKYGRITDYNQVYSDLVGTKIIAPGASEWRIQSPNDFMSFTLEHLVSKSQSRQLYKAMAVIKSPDNQNYAAEFTLEYQLQGLSWVLTDVAVDSAFSATAAVDDVLQEYKTRLDKLCCVDFWPMYSGYLKDCTLEPSIQSVWSLHDTFNWSFRCDGDTLGDYGPSEEMGILADICTAIEGAGYYPRIGGVLLVHESNIQERSEIKDCSDKDSLSPGLLDNRSQQ